MLRSNQILDAGSSGVSAAARTVSLTALVFLCFALLRVSIFHPDLLYGNDFFWHLMYGNYILDHGTLPQTDWLSWTFEGKPYQITQWLGEVLLALSVRAGGPLLLSGLITGSACLSLFFAWRTTRLYVSHRMLALILAMFCVSPVLMLTTRPQVFGLTAFAALVWLLAVWFQRKEKWALLGMSVVMVLWVNLHGSFVIGALYIAALGGGAWLTTLAEMKGKFVASVQAHLPLAIASFAAIFSVLLNPYGWHAFEYVYKIAHLKTTTSGVISEWQATSLTTANGQAFFIIVLAVLAAISFAKQRPSVATMLGFIGTVYFGLQADRQSYIALIALVPFLAEAVRGSRFESEMAQKLSNEVAVGKALIALSLVVWLACTVHVVAKESLAFNFEANYPAKALEFLDKNNIQGKLFNRLEHGGYIASKGRKVFMDGRLDLFGDDMAFGTYYAVNGKAGWQEFLKKYNPDLFILRNEDILLEHLLNTNKCASIYSDKYHSVLQCS